MHKWLLRLSRVAIAACPIVSRDQKIEGLQPC
jgi:hypothetical protein